MTYGEVTELIDRGFIVEMSFLDCSKALDVVNYFNQTTNVGHWW